jgi:hypothetical protein
MSKETKVAINVGNTVFYTLPESQAPRNPSKQWKGRVHSYSTRRLCQGTTGPARDFS